MGTKILLDEVRTATGTDWAADKVVVGAFDTKAVVFVTASGKATNHDVPGAAGILVSIIEDTHDIAVRDDSFEAQSLNQRYRAAVSRVIVLPAGEHLVINGRVDPLGVSPSFNQNSALRLEVVAIAAE